MAVDKFTRMARTLPSFYKAETNTMIRGLLQSWGVSDDEIEIQIQNAKDSIFVETSEGRFLDFLGNNVGVARATSLGIDDDDFRDLIPILSFKPKQIRKTIIDLLDVFWGPGFTRANVTSGNIETYNFGPASLATGTASFVKGRKLVKGTGTSFTTEIFPGDYIKPNTADGTTYSKVSAVPDDESIELSVEWDFDTSIGTPVEIGVIRELSYETDDASNQKTLRFTPNGFSDLTAVTVSELVTYINNNIEHNKIITASEFLDPILGTKLNLRTITPGIKGNIQITGGDANDVTRFNFNLDKQIEIKAGVFEINPNEIIVRIPSSVPVLRRSLKGSSHPKETKTEILSGLEVFDFSGLGASSTLEVTIDGTPFTVTFTHASDFSDSSAVLSEEVAEVINAQLTFLQAFTSCSANPKTVGLRTTEGSSDYRVTGGTANTVLSFDTTLQEDPDIIISGFPSSYIFDPTGQLFTVTGTSSELTTAVTTGTILSTLSLADVSSFQNSPGKFMLNFGRTNQEGPINYNSRPNNSTLLIDASHIFDSDHDVDSKVNFVVNQPTIPRLTGDDYPVFIVGTEAAREAAQDIIKSLLASGVVIRFIIDFPEVLFECIVRGTESSTDPDFRGSLTGSGPLFFC